MAVENREEKLIASIRKKVGASSRRVRLGIGDDGAILESPKGSLVATVDTLVEGIHFDLAYWNANEIGYKALAVNLSDVAAMGGDPLYALVSLGLRDTQENGFVEALYEGMTPLLNLFEIDVVGGNIVRSPQSTFIDITLLGEVNDQWFTRSGAKPGHILAVSGPLGESAAGLRCLQKLGREAREFFPAVTKRFLTPMPRVRESRAVMETGSVSALIDISDGLSTELHHLAASSGVGILVNEELLAPSEPLKQACEYLGLPTSQMFWNGGEDYELLMAIESSGIHEVRTALRLAGADLIVLGEVQAQSLGVCVKTSSGLVPIKAGGWHH